MRLRQDIEIGYEVRSSEHTKRRGGVFSPRKGGGRSNLSAMRGSDDILSQTKTMHSRKSPQKVSNNQYVSPVNEKSSMHSPEKKIPRPTSAPIQRPKSANPQRVRKAIIKPTDNVPWDSSTGKIDRDYLMLLQDNEISKFRQAAWDPPVSARPTTANIGPSHEYDRKTITSSYSRCREARTSGPILNIASHHVGYAQKTAERISEITSTGIHDSRWNVSTKDRDEEPRARPDIPIDSKSSNRFHETFYSTDVWRAISSRGVIKSQQSVANTTKTWDDIKKVHIEPNMLPQSKFRVR